LKHFTNGLSTSKSRGLAASPLKISRKTPPAPKEPTSVQDYEQNPNVCDPHKDPNQNH